MVEQVKSVFRTAFSGTDNFSMDIGRILWAVSVLAGVLFAGFVCWHTKQFDIIAFGTGMGALLAGGGAALKLKETTEPGKDKE